MSRGLRWLLYGLTLLLFINDDYGNWDNLFLVAVKKYFYMGVVAFALGNLLFNPDSVISWRRPTFFHYLGKISYGIYMYHGFVIFFITKQFPRLHDGLFLLWVLLITLVVCVAALAIALIVRRRRGWRLFRPG